jgi:hypothetical protein
VSAERQPVVTDDHINLDLLTGGDRTLELAGRRYPVRRELSVPMMRRLLTIEAELNEGLADDNGDERVQHATLQGYDEIMALIREKTPDAEDLDLDTRQVLVMLSWLAGDNSVADAIARALTAGVSGAKSAEELEDPEVDPTVEGEDAGLATPFDSSTHSTGLSSSSDDRTDGSLATGSSLEERLTVSPGGSSAATSSTPEHVTV